MQTKSLFALALVLAALPSTFACTVVEKNAGDDTMDGGNGDPESDEETDTGNGGDTSDTDGPATNSDTDESDTVAPGESDASSSAVDGGPATADGGDTTSEGDGGESAVEGDGGSDETEATTDADGGEATEEPEGDAGLVEGDVFKMGNVSLSQLTISAAGFSIVSSSASAGFSIITTEPSSGDVAPSLPCETETVGGCTLSVCDVTDTMQDPDAPKSTTKSVSAGDITITGLAQEITLTANDSGQYQAASGTEMMWEGGETVIATAPGSDDVPEFSVELTAPSAVTLTAPEADALGAIAVSRGEALEVTWTEGDEGNITLMLIDSNSDEVTRSVTCIAPLSAGSITVDDSLLADFSDEGAFSASVGVVSSTTAEDWSVNLSATGSLASGTVAFSD